MKMQTTRAAQTFHTDLMWDMRVVVLACLVALAAAGCGGHKARVQRHGGPVGVAADSSSICAQTRIAQGSLWSEKTGQHTATFVVTNLSDQACALDGYPRVQLLDAQGRLLRFRYHRGGDQMIAADPPHRVVLPPAGRAFFAVNKYRCDLRATATARTILVRLPGAAAWLRLRLRSYPRLDYCSERPSLTVTVSPVRVTLAAVAARG
jgi:hypothetical protein